MLHNYHRGLDWLASLLCRYVRSFSVNEQDSAAEDWDIHSEVVTLTYAKDYHPKAPHLLRSHAVVSLSCQIVRLTVYSHVWNPIFRYQVCCTSTQTYPYVFHPAPQGLSRLRGKKYKPERQLKVYLLTKIAKPLKKKTGAVTLGKSPDGRLTEVRQNFMRQIHDYRCQWQNILHRLLTVFSNDLTNSLVFTFLRRPITC